MSEVLLQALQNKDLYNHTIEEFQLLETHISWVLLTGNYAYKIKKPVNFGFLDFTSLEKRKYYCEEELRLNQRLAPDLYLEVIPIYGNPEQPSWHSSKEIIEYAIKMHQFSQDQLLDHLQAKRKLTPHHIIDTAKLLALFHQQVPAANPHSQHGSAEIIIEPIKQNFQQILPWLQTDNDKKQLAQLETWALETYDRNKAILMQRKTQGMIRECHGDVHLKNIALFNNQVTLFDCIEFNEAFRWIDIISEVSFLVMDLEDRKLNYYAWLFLNEYLETTGDYLALPLLNFYKAYRAMVRAKVSLLRLTQENLAKDTVKNIWQTYYNYINLAESYTQIPHPCLIITCGVSGSGKTTLSSQLIEPLKIIRLRSDVERKRLFGINANEKSESALSEGIYDKANTTKTYQHLKKIADSLLQAGFSVMVDATFLTSDQRSQFLHIAESHGIPFIIINCHADNDIIKQRIQDRLKRIDSPDASEATLDVLEQQLKNQEQLGPEELKHAININTENLQDSEKFIHAIRQKLAR